MATLKIFVAAATAFVAKCYGSTVQGSMSDIRYNIWLKKTSKRKVTVKPKLQTLPPTTEAFRENANRAHLQACIWKSTLSTDLPDMDPCKFGWSKMNQPNHSYLSQCLVMFQLLLPMYLSWYDVDAPRMSHAVQGVVKGETTMHCFLQLWQGW